MTEVYREATDDEVRNFALQDRLSVADVDGFINDADQTIRKLVGEIVSGGFLQMKDLVAVQNAAATTNLSITIKDGKIVMPTHKKEVKALLMFLNESRYTGPISGTPYLTNSRRPAE